MTELEANIHTVQERIKAACQRASRDPAEITLVAVTKTQPPHVIQAAYGLGLKHFGENRVEEAEGKTQDLPSSITWHMIGHIQSRKARRVISTFSFVHSVDSLKLARRLSRQCADRESPLPVLLECNISGEASKYGFDASQWFSAEATRESLLAVFEEITNLPHVQVQGLMTMAPIVSSPEQTRPVFAALRSLRDELAQVFPQIDWAHLSMGMTDDFEVALEEGATMIRVGRAIFSPTTSPWRKG
jgi:pyridoxal phosphate enzyme (YggS family)